MKQSHAPALTNDNFFNNGQIIEYTVYGSCIKTLYKLKKKKNMNLLYLFYNYIINIICILIIIKYIIFSHFYVIFID